MTEVWLHPNRRVLLLAMFPALALGVLGGLLVRETESSLIHILGMMGLAISLMMIVGLVRQLASPRIAYRQGHVLFYLKSARPFEVPVKTVEAFFQGQGPAHLPSDKQYQTKSVNLVARLSQKFPDWQHREVKPALGSWDEGYVTIRGTWCEPITLEVIRRLNRRLKEVSTEAADNDS